MKKMKELARMLFLTKFGYMEAFWFNVLGTGASIVIYYFLWQFVFQKQNTLQGFTMAQMTTNVILPRRWEMPLCGRCHWQPYVWALSQ